MIFWQHQTFARIELVIPIAVFSAVDDKACALVPVSRQDSVSLAPGGKLVRLRFVVMLDWFGAGDPQEGIGCLWLFLCVASRVEGGE
jgi:hypothetical protein